MKTKICTNQNELNAAIEAGGCNIKIKGKWEGNVDLRDAKIGGDVYLRDAKIGGYVYLRDAEIGGNVYLSRAKIEGNVYLSSAEIGGNVYLLGTEIEGNVDLSGAKIEGNVYLSGAEMPRVKNDFYEVLSAAPAEIEYLKQALAKGKVDGTTYDGECCCLNGTLAAGAKNEKEKESIIAFRDASRPIERFFLAIRPGHTPENHPVAKIVNEWIDEFEEEFEKENK